jgi:hypothetical protein
MTSNPNNDSHPTSFHPVHFLQQLEREIERRQEELTALMHVREVLLGGQPATTTALPGPKAVHVSHTVADAVEVILGRGDGTGLHVADLLPALHKHHGIQITSKNLINTLNRWVTRGRRFKRTAPNTFALAVDGAGRSESATTVAVTGGHRRHR